MNPASLVLSVQPSLLWPIPKNGVRHPVNCGCALACRGGWTALLLLPRKEREREREREREHNVSFDSWSRFFMETCEKWEARRWHTWGTGFDLTGGSQYNSLAVRTRQVLHTGTALRSQPSVEKGENMTPRGSPTSMRGPQQPLWTPVVERPVRRPLLHDQPQRELKGERPMSHRAVGEGGSRAQAHLTTMTDTMLGGRY